MLDPHFHLYDRALLGHITKVHEFMNLTLSFSDRYTANYTGSLFVFGKPGDMPLDVEEQTDWDAILGAAIELNKALDVLLGHVREQFLEIDIKELSLAAWRDYQDFEKTVEKERTSGTDTPQRFYRRDVHLEYRVNADANVVNNYLLGAYTGIMRTIHVGDSEYLLTDIRAFSPEEHATFQYGLIASGRKETAQHGYFLVGETKMTSDPLMEAVPEMFFITISQGQKDVSMVNFDTDTRELQPFSDGMVQELGKAFSVTSLST
jgi:hypothetical protein